MPSLRIVIETVDVGVRSRAIGGACAFMLIVCHSFSKVILHRCAVLEMMLTVLDHLLTLATGAVRGYNLVTAPILTATIHKTSTGYTGEGF